MRLAITGGKVDKRQRTHPNEEVLEKRSIESFDLANIDYKTLDSFKKRTIGIPIVKLLLLIHQKARRTLNSQIDSKCCHIFRIDLFWHSSRIHLE